MPDALDFDLTVALLGVFHALRTARDANPEFTTLDCRVPGSGGLRMEREE